MKKRKKEKIQCKKKKEDCFNMSHLFISMSDQVKFWMEAIAFVIKQFTEKKSTGDLTDSILSFLTSVHQGITNKRCASLYCLTLSIIICHNIHYFDHYMRQHITAFSYYQLSVTSITVLPCCLCTKTFHCVLLLDLWGITWGNHVKFAISLNWFYIS